MDSDEGMSPEHLLKHPGMKGMTPELPGLESKLLSHVSTKEICSQESSSSDKESLALESIGSSDKEGGRGGSSQEGSSSDKEGGGGGSDSDKDGRLANVNRRKLEKLPEIAEEAEEEDEYQKAKVWKEWWDRNKKKREEYNLQGCFERIRDLSYKTTDEIRGKLEEYWKSVPSPPSNLGAVDGLDPVFKSFFLHHDVDPKLWEKYVAECQESEGFDVFTFPGSSSYLVVRPVTAYTKDPELHQELIDLATRALEEKQPGYQFLHIEWVTGYSCAGDVYFITFRARGADAPDGKSFQAKVYAGINKVEVIFCRPKDAKT